MRAMMEKLATHMQEDPTAKAVVFSQFTSFLDVIGKSLRAEGIAYGAYTCVYTFCES